MNSVSKFVNRDLPTVKSYICLLYTSTEEAYERCLKSLKEMVAEAEKFGVMVAIEGVARHVLSTP